MNASRNPTTGAWALARIARYLVIDPDTGCNRATQAEAFHSLPKAAPVRSSRPWTSFDEPESRSTSTSAVSAGRGG
ncbi:hypothetical protein HNR23_004454 [Nocardiopsis mwathae]|uniref:Uncharacterized protein n=1 Tax=Nocardiopsis mwathae TaxID=1472723 RepID=A0A7X0D8U9_9ACTN|nr:hypothetical protein [Nocardiopsis mwathae]MBB6174394.1 hypothetical protein [Nocardiopsis mwathae]